MLLLAAPAVAAPPGDPPPVVQIPGVDDEPPLPAGGPPSWLGAVPAPAPGGGLVAALRRPEPASGPVRAISDGRTFTGRTPADLRLAATALGRLPALGARVVRLPLSWSGVEGGHAIARPEDPADPDYAFAPFDRLVRTAAANGLTVLATVYGAPRRAEAEPRWVGAPRGSWAPDPAEFARFLTAAATRYSGRYPDPLEPGRTLPRVPAWQLWNEPNLPRYLTPQWVVRGGRWVPFAPGRYRALLNAGERAVHAVDPGATVVTAGTAPLGEPRDGEGRMAPVRFWRALLCRGCTARFDAWAHHPVSVGDPERPTPGPLDVGIADLGRLRRIVGPKPLWITELNWDAFPDSRTGVPSPRLRRYVAEGLELLHRQGAALVAYQFLRDPTPLDGLAGAHPAGLFRIDPARPFDPDGDRPKSAVRAWTMPWVARRRDPAHVRAWGLLGRPGARPATVERRVRGRWRRLATLRSDPTGLVRGTVRLRGAALLRLRDPDTGQASPAWRVGRAADPLA